MRRIGRFRGQQLSCKLGLRSCCPSGTNAAFDLICLFYDRGNPGSANHVPQHQFFWRLVELSCSIV